MPLQKGKEHIGDNVDEMMASWARTGKIGNTRPRNKSHARLIALAASRRAAGLPMTKGKPRKG